MWVTKDKLLLQKNIHTAANIDGETFYHTRIISGECGPMHISSLFVSPTA